MSRLFIFAIGGTGSRVVKSLAMLLAAGVKINASAVIPIIIDPDSTNGDMERTIEILRNYGRVRDKISHTTNQFFNANIQTLKSLTDKSGANSQLAEVFKYGIDGSKEGRFREFIDYTNLDAVNRALVDLLFSKENLDLHLQEGFKGNPNIGSVVLNKFKDSAEFRNFASIFNKDDRIFIISSIFGGTGAAGFPLMLKNIRNADSTLASAKFLQDARIGALSVLPYFGVAPKKGGKIDKDTFISKTKAALAYYKRNIIDNNSVNAMYYVGDDISQNYEYSEGQTSQKNRAHIAELVGATSIIDFMDMTNDRIQTRQGKAVAPVFKEYGLKEGLTTVNFTHFPQAAFIKMFRPLTQYAYFCLYMRQRFDKSINKQPWSERGNIRINNDFRINNVFYTDYLSNFNRRFWEWLEEMSMNVRGFKPYELGVDEDSLYKFVEGITQKGGGLFGLNKSWSYSYYDKLLNAAEKKVGDPPVETKFMDIFYLATQEIMDEKFAQV